jgi:hypothetical protein
MKEIDKWIRIFEIFKKYEKYGFEIDAEHDEIFLGCEPEHVSKDDIEELDKLGVYIGEYGFTKFV